ncbi:Endonuclease III [hydrothermal vent metagenome]|uniref:Endonuclease III n=1 Tax=hydrothermal vent metagenome TaxID=652676 RepID=A0A3B0QYT8_9ZZZZ
MRFFTALFTAYGPQGWWPAETKFEVIVGAVLTQNTNWGNVERAIANLKEAGVLTPDAMHALTQDSLAKLIRPAGYFNVKAGRLGNFLEHLFNNYGDGEKNLTDFLKKDTEVLRAELLSVNGIGPETADSILLYAARKAVFVIDAYTKRILTRHGLIGDDAGYAEMQALFMDNLEEDSILFNEYHALIVMTGKDYCKTKKPLCDECPLGSFL